MARPDARVAQATNHRNVFLEEKKSVLILWEAEEEDEEEEKSGWGNGGEGEGCGERKGRGKGSQG